MSLLITCTANEFYILIKGHVRIHQHDEKLGEFALENEIATLGPYDCLGETALQDVNATRTASCTAAGMLFTSSGSRILYS